MLILWFNKSLKREVLWLLPSKAIKDTRTGKVYQEHLWL